MEIDAGPYVIARPTVRAEAYRRALIMIYRDRLAAHVLLAHRLLRSRKQSIDYGVDDPDASARMQMRPMLRPLNGASPHEP
ncbi:MULTISPECIES: hypothetical protein [Bradyrhizobium]|uniref:hypothetical protein n=1 Tax=Bradyrhizobium TaxID=374 RepID=UPI0004ADE78F|nr:MULTISPECIES: hypothetical protein [unclassified Bradyrhizobium]MDA9426034.1 hypothetical protein [Bradyrhizobium sp. CCBAU 53380]